MKENFYHGILLGLLAYIDGWSVRSNAESGEGYSDISLEIRAKGIGIVIKSGTGGRSGVFNSEEQLLASGKSAMRMYFMGFFLMSPQFSGQRFFYRIGKVKQAVCFSMLRKAIIVVPLTLLLPPMGGLGIDAATDHYTKSIKNSRYLFSIAQSYI